MLYRGMYFLELNVDPLINKTRSLMLESLI